MAGGPSGKVLEDHHLEWTTPGELSSLKLLEDYHLNNY
jgi:hypothetical protein